jgi:hypothetical protein
VVAVRVVELPLVHEAVVIRPAEFCAGGLRLRYERVHVGTGREVEREGDQRGRRRVADLLAAVAEAGVVVAAERHQVQVVIEDEARGVVVGDGLVDAPAESGEEGLGASEIGDREVREEVRDSLLVKSKCVVKRIRDQIRAKVEGLIDELLPAIA